MRAILAARFISLTGDEHDDGRAAVVRPRDDGVDREDGARPRVPDAAGVRPRHPRRLGRRRARRAAVARPRRRAARAPARLRPDPACDGRPLLPHAPRARDRDRRVQRPVCRRGELAPAGDRRRGRAGGRPRAGLAPGRDPGHRRRRPRRCRCAHPAARGAAAPVPRRRELRDLGARRRRVRPRRARRPAGGPQARGARRCAVCLLRLVARVDRDRGARRARRPRSALRIAARARVPRLPRRSQRRRALHRQCGRLGRWAASPPSGSRGACGRCASVSRASRP